MKPTTPFMGIPPVRVAIYARYSSDLQRPSSVSDQVRQCREAAARNGWVVAEDYIRSDEALSGRTRVGRVGLDELMTLAEGRSRPFDGIVIDDTSRFGRNLSDTLPMSDSLHCFGVFLYFANRDLDSRSVNFRTLFGDLRVGVVRHHLKQCDNMLNAEASPPRGGVD